MLLDGNAITSTNLNVGWTYGFERAQKCRVVGLNVGLNAHRNVTEVCGGS